jgi:8-oxo-dGTP pyrophosphatase MutT (NUDIX family)
VLYDDAVSVLTGWTATSDEADLARKRTLELLGAGPMAMTREHQPGHVTASALVVDDDGRVLLCLHGRIKLWMQLGGHCEAGDATLAAAALREATEESGIGVSALRLDPEPIDVDVHEVTCGGRPSAHHDVRFLIRCAAGTIERISDESAELGWFDPADLPSPLASATDRLIPPAFARL